MNPLATVVITALVAVVAEQVLSRSGLIKDPTIDLDSPEREIARHANDTGEVAGDIINGVITGGSGEKYRYLFTASNGDRIYSIDGRANGNYWNISTIPGIDPILWGVAPPSSLTSGSTPALLVTDIVRNESAPQHVFSHAGASKGYVNSNGTFSTSTDGTART